MLLRCWNNHQLSSLVIIFITSSILLCQVRKPPDITKTNRISNGGQDEGQFAVPSFSALFYSHKHLTKKLYKLFYLHYLPVWSLSDLSSLPQIHHQPFPDLHLLLLSLLVLVEDQCLTQQIQPEMIKDKKFERLLNGMNVLRSTKQTFSIGEKATLRGFLGSIPAWTVYNRSTSSSYIEYTLLTW